MDIQIQKPIVLVGMMGCGKSCIGKALAEAIGFEFFDIDHLIEQQEGRSIAKIFLHDGEAGFRRIEARLIGDVLDRRFCVISTGGGALTDKETLCGIKEMAVSVWLRSDLDSIMSRIKDDKTRPLLQCDNPREQLGKLLRDRKALYEQADIHVNNNADDECCDVVDDIIQALKNFL